MTKDLSTTLCELEELFDNAKLVVEALEELRNEYSEDQWDKEIDGNEFISALVDSAMDLEATVEQLSE
tara:strand:- start:435 stop:638 length:204 start_codon:yes stop_codon:yes gene_type:complete